MRLQQVVILFGTLLLQLDATIGTNLYGDASLRLAPRNISASIDSDPPQPALLQRDEDWLGPVNYGTQTNEFGDDATCAPLRHFVPAITTVSIGMLYSECISPTQYTAQCIYVDHTGNDRETTETYQCAENLVCEDIEEDETSHYATCVSGQPWQAVTTGAGTSIEFALSGIDRRRRVRVATDAWGFTSNNPTKLSRVHVAAITYTTDGLPAGGSADQPITSISNYIRVRLHDKVTVRVIAGGSVIGSFLYLATHVYSPP